MNISQQTTTDATRTTADLAAHIAQSTGKYQLRLATSDEDMRAIYQLRFQVFNLELNEGLQASYATGMDEDQYDAQCHHLLIENTDDRAIVGTYRMQDQCMAKAGAGFYSAAEFDLSTLPATLLSQAVELGRACIDAQHRNTRVLFLLWRGLAAYMVAGGHRYFFGCCSLTSQQPDDGLALYDKLVADGVVDQTLLVQVQSDYVCIANPSDNKTPLAPRIPKLMRLYLAYGARIISGPALDREFSTIDYLALFDLNTLSETNRKMFLEHG